MSRRMCMASIGVVVCTRKLMRVYDVVVSRHGTKTWLPWPSSGQTSVYGSTVNPMINHSGPIRGWVRISTQAHVRRCLDHPYNKIKYVIFCKCSLIVISASYDEQQAMQSWFDERQNYDYNSQVCSEGQCGHYTQVTAFLRLSNAYHLSYRFLPTDDDNN